MTLAGAPAGEARARPRPARGRGLRRAGDRRKRLRGGRRPRRSSRLTTSATAGWTCSSTTPASGIGAPVGEISTKHLDMQLDINLRSIVAVLPRMHGDAAAAAAEHHNALVVNTSSISGKHGEGWLGVLGHQAWCCRLDGSDEQGARLRGHQVDRAMPRLRGHADDRVRQGPRTRRADDPPEDIAESVRFLLKLSPPCAWCRRSCSCAPARRSDARRSLGALRRESSDPAAESGGLPRRDRAGWEMPDARSACAGDQRVGASAIAR